MDQWTMGKSGFKASQHRNDFDVTEIIFLKIQFKHV
jgi:hypothetical protein